MKAQTHGWLGAVRTVAERVFAAMLTVWALASTVFFALRLLPGDPAVLILGELADASSRAALRARLHLDEPLAVQYLRFLWGLVTLNPGPSLSRPGMGAMDRVWQVLPPTASLASLAVLLGTVGGLIGALLSVGPWLGTKRKYVHGTLIAIAATPLMAMAPIATYWLALRWRVVPLPGDPSSGFGGLLFASGLLAIPLGAQVARVGRAALLDLGKAQFLSVARAKGSGALRVWVLHGLPATSAPIIAVIATQLGALLGGAVVLERLFDRPGLGSLMLDSYAKRDIPVLEGSILASGAMFVATQAMASVIHVWLDPRARSGS
jgi:peptide/nickel transport system permease protein